MLHCCIQSRLVTESLPHLRALSTRWATGAVPTFSPEFQSFTRYYSDRGVSVSYVSPSAAEEKSSGRYTAIESMSTNTAIESMSTTKQSWSVSIMTTPSPFEVLHSQIGRE